jgi:hypothetical protein
MPTNLNNRSVTIVREKDYGKSHEVYDGAPCEWSASHGATHTLYCGEGVGKGTRPAKLLKTCLHVGVDESPEGGIVWEIWEIRHTAHWPR